MFNTGEIVWARVAGFPWWPGHIISPTAAQLKSLSIQTLSPDQRLVCFFNDNDRYQLLNVANLRRFREHQFTPLPKSKKPKLAAKLKLAFEQASERYQRPNNIEDEEPIDAVVITPFTAIDPQSSAKPSRKSKKTKLSDHTSSPDLEQPPPKQFSNSKTPQPTTPTKKTQSAPRISGDAESDRLSTHCNPSPCDRSSQETGIDSRPNLATSKHTPPRRILLNLRIREKRTSAADKEKRKDPPRPDSSSRKRKAIEKRARTTSSGGQLRKKEQKSSLASKEESANQSIKKRKEDLSEEDDKHVEKDGTDRARRVKKRKGSDLPQKLRHGALNDGEDTVKRRRLTTTKGAVENKKRGLPEVRVLDYPLDIDNVSSDDEKVKVSRTRRAIPEPPPSTEVTEVRASERAPRSDAPIRRSRRMRRVSSKMGGTDEGSGSDSESEDDAQLPVASKRSRGVEAPRMSDGQRRFHIRHERKEKRSGDGASKRENGKRTAPGKEHLFDDNMSDSGVDESMKAFEDLTKDECLKVIYKLRATLRRKSIQLWLRGRKLVEARDVLRTEEALTKACEPHLEKAERLLRWVKKHKSYEKGKGSRFANLEGIALKECESLFDVYFDRRKVGLKNIGPRLLKVAKELEPHSSKVTEVLLDLLLLWLDLTGSSKKMAGIKLKQ